MRFETLAGFRMRFRRRGKSARFWGREKRAHDNEELLGKTNFDAQGVR
jgi:hypothetical protein